MKRPMQEVATEQIEQYIRLVRNQRVILDSDLSYRHQPPFYHYLPEYSNYRIAILSGAQKEWA